MLWSLGRPHGSTSPAKSMAEVEQLRQVNWKCLLMELREFRVDEGPHNSDGLILHGLDGTLSVTGFVSRRVLDDWTDPGQPYGVHRKSLLREQYNALGKRNLPAFKRMVAAKYEQGPKCNRRYPFVDVLLNDILLSGEVLV
jgi:hypothetical protein